MVLSEIRIRICRGLNARYYVIGSRIGIILRVDIQRRCITDLACTRIILSLNDAFTFNQPSGTCAETTDAIMKIIIIIPRNIVHIFAVLTVPYLLLSSIVL
jgi:hypothetical protein